MSDIYKVEEYQRFADNLKAVLDGPNIKSFKLNQLRKHALETGRQTSNGAWSWRSSVSSRIGPKTVYLGGEKVRLPKPTELHKSIIENAPDELHKVLHLMRTLPFIHLRRQMANNSEYNPICNLYISVADKTNFRLAYMWGNTMFDPSKRPGPEFTMIHIPEEHHLRQQVLSIPEHNINIALGTDYMGENKKGFLRQAMWFADELGMLGLHSGTKIVTVWDERDKRLKRYGVFLFGLSATGKSTWSCHQLGLDHDKKEGTEVAQDDIAFLRRDGSAYGSEANFFVKTDVQEKLQEAMYWSLVDKTALYENVMVDAAGNPDFLDENLCGNGRAVIRKDKLKVKRGRKLVRIDSPSVNLPPLSELDGLVFAFITRRNTIMPFGMKLTPEQGVLAYLWGESSHSAASEPDKAGESVRTVGTDPFIVGSLAAKVNKFYDIVMDLVNDFPGKVHFYQYNTGGIGEILEKSEVNGKIIKNLVRKVKRVPINVMAAIQRGDLRGTNQYIPGRLGVLEIKSCADANLDEYNPDKYYSKDQIDAYVKDLVDGRRDYTEFIASQGLKQEIIDSAEESFSIAGGKKAKVSVPDIPQEKTKEEKPSDKIHELPDIKWETKSRPRRNRMGRY
ncbi:MAG: phosphoenolpyruvate carboxykinase (ATP) [candidate division Zixibacteria bacterium]|nr:phosphoenolpyruvate carboxykinase (ATP) [candidate division Zixibacteria bacterium]